MEELDKRFMRILNKTTGKEEKVPCLDARWKQEMHFIDYNAFPSDHANGPLLEEWLERITFIEDDLNLLLKMPHDKFWCQIVFDGTVRRCLDSYLRLAPRWFDVERLIPDSGREIYQSVHKLVFMTFVRMATYKESKECCFTPEVFGDIIYENFLFDIPNLMDLSVLYGANNAAILGKMITNIFTQQPKYNNDLKTAVSTINQIFQTVLEMCGFKSDSSAKLLDAKTSLASLASLPLNKLKDLMFYFVDISYTLYSFLDVYPSAAKAFNEHNFLMTLVQAVERAGGALLDSCKQRDWLGLSNDRQMLKKNVIQAQLSLVKVFRQIVFHSYLQQLLENSTHGSDQVENTVESYLHIISSTLADKRFLGMYESLFPFEADKDLLNQTSYLIDDTRFQFIEHGISEAVAEHGRKHISPAIQEPAATVNSGIMSTSVKTSDGIAFPAVSNKFEHYENSIGGACAALPEVSEVQLVSMIAAVKDLLPDLGDGFIEVCLEEFCYDVEQVINALLEEKLPQSLQELDRFMPRDKVVSLIDAEVPSLINERRNIYDNDEFDVFTRNVVDTSKVHIGKKEKSEDVVSVRREIREKMRPVYDRYGSEFVDSIYENNVEYEDEYDDTYDDNSVSAYDADSVDDLAAKRPLMTPRVLDAGSKAAPANVENLSEESEDDELSAAKRDEFVMDPAKIREAQAARAAQRQETRNRQQWKPESSTPARTSTPREHDVKGAPKGQGQSAEVLHNRAWKEKNKSAHVHHNRRNLADKKRQF